MQNIFYILIVTLLSFYLLGIDRKVLACLSITDDLNLPNPTLRADFNLTPELGPFKECWGGALRIRSRNKNWRLVANRTGPNPLLVNGDRPQDDIKASDVSFQLKLKGFGKAQENGGILIPPFDRETRLSSIKFGTLIASGLKKSGNSCLPQSSDYYRLANQLCMYRDFVYNTGDYEGELSYTLVAP